jgi:hypothetical protein
VRSSSDCRSYHRAHCRSHCRAHCRSHCRAHCRSHCRSQSFFTSMSCHFVFSVYLRYTIRINRYKDFEMLCIKR